MSVRMIALTSLRKLWTALLLASLVCLSKETDAQSLPPRPIQVTVNNSQPLAFGAFTPGAAGGSVIVNTNYSRSSTGTVVLFNLGYSYTPAMLYVRGNPGTVVTVTLSPSVTLTGSNGGVMTLIPGPVSPASPFVITVPFLQATELLIGGSLNVGSIGSNPAGNYSGTFSITFNQQ